MFVRAALPRKRFDQLISICGKYLFPLTLTITIGFISFYIIGFIGTTYGMLPSKQKQFFPHREALHVMESAQQGCTVLNEEAFKVRLRGTLDQIKENELLQIIIEIYKISRPQLLDIIEKIYFTKTHIVPNNLEGVFGNYEHNQRFPKVVKDLIETHNVPPRNEGPLGLADPFPKLVSDILYGKIPKIEEDAVSLVANKILKLQKLKETNSELGVTAPEACEAELQDALHLKDKLCKLSPEYAEFFDSLPIKK